MFQKSVNHRDQVSELRVFRPARHPISRANRLIVVVRMLLHPFDGLQQHLFRDPSSPCSAALRVHFSLAIASSCSDDQIVVRVDPAAFGELAVGMTLVLKDKLGQRR